ncbi:hypothetical protein M1437_04555, partial [Patescibacteria group bacterium]|nr:hypothetical protein [Patescibacteria group bacterium]
TTLEKGKAIAISTTTSANKKSVERLIAHELAHALSPGYNHIDSFLTPDETINNRSQYSALTEAYKNQVLISGKPLSYLDREIQETAFLDAGNKIQLEFLQSFGLEKYQGPKGVTHEELQKALNQGKNPYFKQIAAMYLADPESFGFDTKHMTPVAIAQKIAQRYWSEGGKSLEPLGEEKATILKKAFDIAKTNCEEETWAFAGEQMLTNRVAYQFASPGSLQRQFYDFFLSDYGLVESRLNLP